ncbi:hypothetical protein BH11MYX1_BH11MYX1_15920 [soil metagenome]
MSELAYSINGETFDLPAAASAWRVRRMKPRGAPEVVYGKDGTPLVVPIEAGLEDLRNTVGTAGRYRLDAINDRGHTVEDLPAAYVVVSAREQAPVHEHRNSDGGASFVMAEAMRLNTELAKAVVERFPQMVEAAASLLRAADGAGLPSRRAIEIATEDDGDDEGDDAVAPAGFDLNALVAQLVPMLMRSLMSGKTTLPDLGGVLDWRKAAPERPRLSKRVEKEQIEAVTSVESVDLPPLDPATMTHFILIQSVLDPDEAALAREVAGNLPPAELRAWFDELSQLSVADAVKKIRVLLKGATS